MNSSNVLHGCMALILQAMIGVVTLNAWYGFFLAAGLFWGREHDQKQHNIAKQKGCTVKDLEWYEGANMFAWHQDSVMDFAVPFVATLVVAIVCSIIA